MSMTAKSTSRRCPLRRTSPRAKTRHTGWFEYLGVLRGIPVCSISFRPYLVTTYSEAIRASWTAILAALPRRPTTPVRSSSSCTTARCHSATRPGAAVRCPDDRLVYDVSISAESGLQVPKRMVAGAEEDREIIVTVANAGPDTATGIVTLTGIDASESVVFYTEGEFTISGGGTNVSDWGFSLDLCNHGQLDSDGLRLRRPEHGQQYRLRDHQGEDNGWRRPSITGQRYPAQPAQQPRADRALKAGEGLGRPSSPGPSFAQIFPASSGATSRCPRARSPSTSRPAVSYKSLHGTITRRLPIFAQQVTCARYCSKVLTPADNQNSHVRPRGVQRGSQRLSKPDRPVREAPSPDTGTCWYGG